ncbi:MAG: ComF family protein [Desulfovibrio sp.]|nr:ComF family protein [Desulfovibrio sp.]
MTRSLAHVLHSLGLDQRRCAHCLRPFSPADLTSPQDAFCPQCAVELKPHSGPCCHLCGLPLAGTHAPGNAVCGACLQDPPPWHALAFHGLYQGTLRDTLLQLKFDGKIYLAKALAYFLLEAASCLPLPDAVVAMPQHPNHLRNRGYNQAHELARALCHLAALNLRTDLLARVVPGPAQAQLSARARRENVRHSFRASPLTAGMTLWLLDDVMTTGSTLRSATHALLTAGADRVDVLFVARTPQHT